MIHKISDNYQDKYRVDFIFKIGHYLVFYFLDSFVLKHND